MFARTAILAISAGLAIAAIRPAQAQNRVSLEGGIAVRVIAPHRVPAFFRISPATVGLSYSRLGAGRSLGWQAQVAVVPGLPDFGGDGGATYTAAEASCAVSSPPGCNDEREDQDRTSVSWAAASVEVVVRPSPTSRLRVGAGPLISVGAGPRGAGAGVGLAAHSMLRLSSRIFVGARAGWLAAGAAPVRFLVSPTVAIGL